MPRHRSWDEIVSHTQFALQPIVNIHTGICFGFEVLLRNVQEAGFGGIQQFFDEAYQDGALPKVELLLQDRALATFRRSGLSDGMRLFINVENRVLGAGAAHTEAARKLIAHHGIPNEAVTYEISERYPLNPADSSLVQMKTIGAKLAIDDFGTGFSGLQLLYRAEPDYIKIDRFFISGISSDSRKRMFVSHIVNIAHLLGILVIAEGVETEQEYYSCKEVGCDLVQGYFVARPTTVMGDLKPAYEHIEHLSRVDRRRSSADCDVVASKMKHIPPLHVDTQMPDVFDVFRRAREIPHFPVINDMGEPLGIITEARIKEFAYSHYGKDLLKNRSIRALLTQFIERVPTVDINTPAEKILEIFSMAAESEAMIVVRDAKYAGILSARSLVQIIHEKKVAAARDQNPLTRLPGNYVIYEYLSQALSDIENTYVLAYLDFDNFKPFNDKYGFRNGDRAILLFSEILQKELRGTQFFTGHVGGDDFFVGYRGVPYEQCFRQLAKMVNKFAADVEGFYDNTDRQSGCLIGRDRDGETRRFPMMRVSAAILNLAHGRPASSIEEAGSQIATIKEGAKHSIDRFCAASLCRLPAARRVMNAKETPLFAPENGYQSVITTAVRA